MIGISPHIDPMESSSSLISFTLEDAYSRLGKGSPLARHLASGDFGQLRRAFEYPSVDVDVLDLIDRARKDSSVYLQLPYCISSDLMSLLNCSMACSEPRFELLLREMIGQLLVQRDENFNYIDEVRGAVSPGWGCGYMVPGMWVHDLATSSEIALNIALYLLHRKTGGHLDQSGFFDDSEAMDVCCSIADSFAKEVVEVAGDWTVWQPFQNDITPTNNVAIYVSLLAILDEIDGNNRYQLIVDRLASSIHRSFRHETDDTVCWGYRINTPEGRSVFGERYWKSPWVVNMMIILYEIGIVFTYRDLEQATNSLLANVIKADGRIYDSMSEQSGELLDCNRIRYHETKGQSFPLKRLINFSPLGRIFPEVISRLESVFTHHEYFKAFASAALNPENYWVLEAMSFCLNHERNALVVRGQK